MAEKTILGQLADEILGAPVPVGATPGEMAQEQRDALEAGVRLALGALSQGSPETARAHLEEALQRAASIGSHPVSPTSPPTGTPPVR